MKLLILNKNIKVFHRRLYYNLTILRVGIKLKLWCVVSQQIKYISSYSFNKAKCKLLQEPHKCCFGIFLGSHIFEHNFVILIRAFLYLCMYWNSFLSNRHVVFFCACDFASFVLPDVIQTLMPYYESNWKQMNLKMWNIKLVFVWLSNTRLNRTLPSYGLTVEPSLRYQGKWLFFINVNVTEGLGIGDIYQWAMRSFKTINVGATTLGWMER